LHVNGWMQEQPSLEAVVKLDLIIYTFFVKSLKEMDID